MMHEEFQTAYETGEPLLFYGILQGFYEAPDFGLVSRKESLWRKLSDLGFTVDVKDNENKITAQLEDKIIHFDTFSCVFQLSFHKQPPDLTTMDQHWTGLKELLGKKTDFERTGTRVTYIFKSTQTKVRNMDRRKLLNPAWLQSFSDKDDLMNRFELKLASPGPKGVETDIEVTIGGVKIEDQIETALSGPIHMTYAFPASVVVDLKRRYNGRAPSGDMLIETDEIARERLLALFEGAGWE